MGVTIRKTFFVSGLLALFAALALGGDGGVKERYCGCKGQGCVLLSFCLFSSSHPIVFL